MKKTFIILFLVIFICSSLSMAQDKPKIFINTNSTVGIFVAVNSGFSQFANIARNLGYTVDHGLHPSIKPEYLEGIDVYILISPPYFLQNSEKVALRQFMRAGGTLILMGWWSLYNEDSLALEYGIEFEDYQIVLTYGAPVAGSPLALPNEVNRTYHKGRRALTVTSPNKAKILAELDDGTAFAAESLSPNVGKGRFLVLNCVDVFAKQYVGGSIELEDNINFTKNLLEYCKGSQDLTVTFVKPKGKKPYPGDDITLIAKVKNLGDRTSEETKLTFYLTDDGLLDETSASPAEVIKKMVTITVPAIEPGITRKLAAKGKVPSFVSPGSYYLVAEVDPDGTSGDAKPENNVKVAKKKLVVK